MILCPWKDIKKYAALLPGIDEAHRNYLDIQYIVKGKEAMDCADPADCKLKV